MGMLTVIQCIPEKRKPKNQVNLSENYKDLSKKVYIVTNSVYPLSFDPSYKMYWSRIAEHEPFQMVMSKSICAEWEIKGLTESAQF